MIQKTEISKDAELFPGDEIEMHFFVIGPVFLRAMMISAVEGKIEKDERFRMDGYEFQGPNDSCQDNDR